MFALPLTLLLLNAAPEPVAGDYAPAAALEALSCVKAWEQLCSVSDSDFPEVSVNETTVVVRPYMDDTELSFEILKKSATRYELQVTHDGAKLTATLTVDGRLLTWVGPDVAELLRGTAGAKATLKLVKRARISTLKAELTKKLVPGGECEGVTDWKEPRKPMKCLNTADGKPAKVELK